MHKRRVLLVGVTAAVVLLDQLTKRWALERLDDGSSVDLVWTLRLKLTFNSGAAFSFGGGSGLGPWIAILALGVVGFLIWKGRMVTTGWGAVALGLILGGAAGNVIDRATRADGGFMSGSVIDFIDLQWWPVFNIADAAIVVGGIVLVLGMFFGSDVFGSDGSEPDTAEPLGTPEAPTRPQHDNEGSP